MDNKEFIKELEKLVKAHGFIEYQIFMIKPGDAQCIVCKNRSPLADLAFSTTIRAFRIAAGTSDERHTTIKT